MYISYLTYNHIRNRNELYLVYLPCYRYIMFVCLQERSHVNPPKQKAVRVQSGRMWQIVLRRTFITPSHRESSQHIRSVREYGEHNVACTRCRVRRRCLTAWVLMHSVRAAAHRPSCWQLW